MYAHLLRNCLIWITLMMALVLVSGCGNEEQVPRQALAEVRYMALAGESITLTRELSGRVSAFTVSEVRPQVGGIIQERLFIEGADVEAGQVLYRIDPVLYQAAYNNAKANLNRVLANENAVRLLAERHGRLVKTGAIGRQEYDDSIAAYGRAKAEIEAFREALETARINLSYTQVTSPVSGRIGRSSVTAGALVTQNQESPLATVQQISPVYVDVTQSNAQILRLRRALGTGQLRSSGPNATKVRLYLEDGSPYIRVGTENDPQWIEGELLFSEITVAESTGSVTIRARFDNPDGLLLPGMYVRAVLEEGVRENALLIPQRSVTRDAQNQPQVHVLSPAQEGGNGPSPAYRVETRPIIIDRSHNNSWLVDSGLAPGELLLVDGVQKVRPGQFVTGREIAPQPDSKPVAMSRQNSVSRR